MTAADEVQVAGEEGGRVADCVHRYQSAMPKMRGSPGLRDGILTTIDSIET